MPTEVGDDEAPLASTTASPGVQTPPHREDSKPSENDRIAEDMHRLMVSTGYVPEEGGDVFTGEVRMFPSPDDYLNTPRYQYMRSSDNLKEGADDEHDFEVFKDNL